MNQHNVLQCSGSAIYILIFSCQFTANMCCGNKICLVTTFSTISDRVSGGVGFGWWWCRSVSSHKLLCVNFQTKSRASNQSPIYNQKLSLSVWLALIREERAINYDAVIKWFKLKVFQCTYKRIYSKGITALSSRLLLPKKCGLMQHK